ncbi:UDP-N-acetylglucosamine transporter YEA4 [Grifola frondosa]|uniref:UDP-N-acetylglucosamine transporter YEA4 n=1 Tax=Grifola frondosa TaxID=5627 RepID=A0A1C7M628_GRIFR|nr:UDP-N-acetylglucosamine transporter YEA4 [Grifola frondosa]
MNTETRHILRDISLSMLVDWAATLTLIFGGCCSNALTLEQLTNEHPQSGSLITFTQFLLVSLYGLPKFVVLSPYPRLKPRQIPILPYFIQVLLFYCISLLNNTAFGYNIPMPVHIIFRSGGLVISMLMGWVLVGRRYNLTQITSVLLVTAGVIFTTLSASGSRGSSSKTSTKSNFVPSTYAIGISILAIALLLSGLLGVIQDRIYARYRRRSPGTGQSTTDKSAAPLEVRNNLPAPWQESMFYLHFLSLPMFFFIREDIGTQFHLLSSGPRIELLSPPTAHGSNSSSFPFRVFIPFGTLSIPAAFLPLIFTSITSLVCVAGVNRLTARVSSLSVTLVLVVRKAVSLIISVILVSAKGRMQADRKATTTMWLGAFLVFAGTLGYSLGAGGGSRKDKLKRE